MEHQKWEWMMGQDHTRVMMRYSSDAVTKMKKKKKNEGCLFHSKWLKLQLINDQIYYDNIICGWWETSPVGGFNVKTDRLTNGAARGFQHDPLVLSAALFIRRHHLFNPTGSSSSPRGLADSLAVVQSTSGLTKPLNLLLAAGSHCGDVKGGGEGWAGGRLVSAAIILN